MSRTIWKYNLNLLRSQKLQLPRIHEMLDIQWQNGGPVLWAMVNPETVSVPVFIFCLPTGDEGPPPEWVHIATLQIPDRTVWHFFRHVTSAEVR